MTPLPTTARLDGLVALPFRGVARRDVAAWPVEVRCVSGHVWLTEEGSHADVLLEAGDVFTASRRGRVVIEALGDAAAVDVRPAPVSARRAPRSRWFARLLDR